jgi:hypothetical protein
MSFARKDGKHLGFCTSEPPGDPHPDVWYGARDEVLRCDECWTDFAESYAGGVVVCAECHGTIERGNRHDPREVSASQHIPGTWRE